MWEILEGGVKFLYAMKLVPSKDLGSVVQSRHHNLKMLFIARAFIESMDT